MQRGTDRRQTAEYLGMGVEVLERVYGRHCPDHLQDAVSKIAQQAPGKERKKDISGALSGAVVKFEKSKS